MATILNVLHYPDPKLRTVAKPVETFGPEILELTQNLFKTMYDQQGIGLAATQVDVHLRVLVLDVSGKGNDPHCFINPEILSTQGEKSYDEGCLSVPGESAMVKRPDIVTVRAFDPTGNPFEKTCDGLMSVCLQHEMDHLQGKLFIDYLSPLKRARIEKRLIQQGKAQQSKHKSSR